MTEKLMDVAFAENNKSLINYLYKYFHLKNIVRISVNHFLSSSFQTRKWFIINNVIIDDIKLIINEVFIKCCEENDIDQVQWIIKNDIDNIIKIDISYDNNYAFVKSCEKGHYEIAKLIYCAYQKNKAFNIYASDCYAFTSSCKNGHYILFDWLLFIDNDTDTNNQKKFIIDEKIILSLCLNQDLHIAKRYENIKTINFKDVHDSYINCIGYTPDLANIRDKYDIQRYSIIQWLRTLFCD